LLRVVALAVLQWLVIQTELAVAALVVLERHLVM
jgi:hypothetical protein